MLIQAASDAADHAHSRAVVTATCPSPPAAGIVEALARSVTSQREIADGAVEVVVDDPHPDAMPVASIAAKKANNRPAGDNGVAHLMFNGRGPHHGGVHVYQERCRSEDVAQWPAAIRRPPFELSSGEVIADGG